MDESDIYASRKQQRRDKGRRRGKTGRGESKKKSKGALSPDWIGKVPHHFEPWMNEELPFPASVGTENITSVDFLCVLDFEATCGGNISEKTREVIGFPSVLIDVRGGAKKAAVAAEFQRYCKPKENPQLHYLCAELTGMTQETVDVGIPFRQALLEHAWWLAYHVNDEDGEPRHSVVIVSCGDWDLQFCLQGQLRLNSLSNVPLVYSRWANIKNTFAQVPPFKEGGSMKSMLDKEGLALLGRHHSEIDDSRNIAILLLHLIRSGAVPEEDLVTLL